MAKTLLVTGASRSVGREICRFFAARDFSVRALDNNLSFYFSEAGAPTWWRPERLSREVPGVRHYEVNLRDRAGLLEVVGEIVPNAIIHAGMRPFTKTSTVSLEEYDTATAGTLNLLEAARAKCPQAPFIFLSSYRVYGDRPGTIPQLETATRWMFNDPGYAEGIGEECPVDHSTHGLFGAAAIAADVLVQEYGRSFFLPTCCLRLGEVVSPPSPDGVPDDVMGQIIQAALTQTPYKLPAFEGKLLRDFIAVEDVAELLLAMLERPGRAEVYNVGGGRQRVCSVREIMESVDRLTGKPVEISQTRETPKREPSCYFTNLWKVQQAFPEWQPKQTVEMMIGDLAREWTSLLKASS